MSVVGAGKLLGVRHVQVALLFVLLFLANALRVIMSMAIVAMTDPESQTTTNSEVYDWNGKQISWILSSFFWGYAPGNLVAALLIKRFEPKVLLTWTCGLSSVLTILSYQMAELGGWQLTCFGRVIQGLCQGFIFPGCHVLLSKWAPPNERARLSTLVYSAAQIGNVVMLLVSGSIISSGIGWPGLFYIWGAIGVLWSVLYWVYGSNSPEVCPRISQQEKDYIQQSLGQITSVEELKNVTTPWRSILTSVPFWALVVVQCAQNYGFYTLLTQIPSYLNYVMKFDIKTNSLLSALPYFIMYVMCLFFGFFSDYLIKSKRLTVGRSRKLFNSFGHYIPCAALIGLGYMSKDSPVAAMALLCVAVGFNGGIYSGYIINHLDLSPIHTGVLMSISNFLGSVHSIMAPLIVGRVVTDMSDPVLWRIIFFATAGYYFVGNSLFVLFGKGTIQPWNYSPIAPENKNVEENKK